MESRIEVTIRPWGFIFASDGVHYAHYGPYASGHFVRGETKIGVSCRNAIDNLYYEHTFITRHKYSTEFERFTIGHSTLMKATGHGDDRRLIVPDRILLTRSRNTCLRPTRHVKLICLSGLSIIEVILNNRQHARMGICGSRRRPWFVEPSPSNVCDRYVTLLLW